MMQLSCVRLLLEAAFTSALCCQHVATGSNFARREQSNAVIIFQQQIYAASSKCSIGMENRTQKFKVLSETAISDAQKDAHFKGGAYF